jgi:tRNA threonylcarbamoyladenosine biosynthesis protein TsaE
MTEFLFEAPDEDATREFGAALARVLPPGTTVALVGTLGAGKTRLVQAIAAACGVARDEVVSPTFVLSQHYRGTRSINHVDAYRLKDEDEFRELGGDELLSGNAITFVEWADRIADALPDSYIQIEITVAGPTARRFAVQAVGHQFQQVIVELARAASAQ